MEPYVSDHKKKHAVAVVTLTWTLFEGIADAEGKIAVPEFPVLNLVMLEMTDNKYPRADPMVREGVE